MGKLIYKKSVVTNIGFIIAGIIQIVFWEQYIIAGLLVMLGITSGIFHYYKSLYHSLKDDEVEWSGVVKTHKKMKFWQDWDVVSIYLIFAFFPYQMSGNEWWLLWALPLVIVSMNKLGWIYPSKHTHSEEIIAAGSVVAFTVAFFYVAWWLVLLSLIFFTISLIFNRRGDKLEKVGNHLSHDTEHSYWHTLTSIGFSLLG